MVHFTPPAARRSAPTAASRRGDSAGLARALHIDPALAATLRCFGVTTANMSLVTWLPAIEMAWCAGCDESLGARIRGTVHALQPLNDDERTLLEAWLTERPAEALFRAARAVMAQHVSQLAPQQREHLIRALLAACSAISLPASAPHASSLR